MSDPPEICPDCGGTGYADELQSEEPCATCAHHNPGRPAMSDPIEAACAALWDGWPTFSDDLRESCRGAMRCAIAAFQMADVREDGEPEAEAVVIQAEDGTTNGLLFRGDPGRFRFVSVCEWVPHGRAFQLTLQSTREEIDAVIGDGLISHGEDERHRAIINRVVAGVTGRPRFGVVAPEPATPTPDSPDA